MADDARREVERATVTALLQFLWDETLRQGPHVSFVLLAVLVGHRSGAAIAADWNKTRVTVSKMTASNWLARAAELSPVLRPLLRQQGRALPELSVEIQRRRLRKQLAELDQEIESARVLRERERAVRFHVAMPAPESSAFRAPEVTA